MMKDPFDGKELLKERTWIRSRVNTISAVLLFVLLYFVWDWFVYKSIGELLFLLAIFLPFLYCIALAGAVLLLAICQVISSRN